MNINQLLNPELEIPPTNPRVSGHVLDRRLGHDSGTGVTESDSHYTYHMPASHLGQDTNVPSSAALYERRSYGNTRLANSVNESTRQSYRVPATYMTHDHPHSFNPIHHSPDIRNTSYSTPFTSIRTDISAHLPIGDMSLHSKASSSTSPAMDSTQTNLTNPAKVDMESSSKHRRHEKKLSDTTQLSASSSEATSSESIQDTDVSEEDAPTAENTHSSWGDDVPDEDHCTFVEHCVLNSPDRKVISHFFGRNKKCTRAIPAYVWAPFCRQHYQRSRYRNVNNFGCVQMELVLVTLDKIQVWGAIAHFEIILRKRAMLAIKREDQHEQEVSDAKAHGRKSPPALDVPRCPDRWLLGYLGKKKSLDEVTEFVIKVHEYCMEKNCKPPEFEILPTFKPGRMDLDEGKSTRDTSKPVGVTKRASRRGSSGSGASARSKRVVTPQSTPKSTHSSLVRSPISNANGKRRKRLVRGLRSNNSS